MFLENDRSAIATLRASAGGLLLASLSGAAMVYAATTQQSPPPKPTPFVDHVRQAGLKACATVYPTLGDMMAGGSDYTVASTWNTKAPETHSVQALAGLTLNTPEYKGPAAGMVLAAPTPAGCEGNAVRIVPLPQSCTMVAKALPVGSQFVRNLSGTLIYDLGADQGQLMLLGNAAHCIAISVKRIG